MTRNRLVLGPGLLVCLLVASPLAAGSAAALAPRELTIVAGEWTWASGSHRIAEWESYAVYGTKGVAAPGNTPGAREGSVSWTDASGSLWLFGGYGNVANSAGYLNDLWKWDGTNWTWVNGLNEKDRPGVYGTKGVAAPGNFPGARSGSVSWKDTGGSLWLFGGYGEATSAFSTGYLNDLWKWDGTSWTWVSGSSTLGQDGIYGTKGVAAPENVPGARTGSVSWTDGSGSFWLFGGYREATSAFATGYLNDLWKWDGTSWTWVSGSDWSGQFGTYGTKGVAAPGNVPGGRSGAISWLDASGNLWLFGGQGRSASALGSLSDLWKWDGANWTWMSGSKDADRGGWYGVQGVAAPGNAPGARSTSVSWTDGSGNLWLFGGYGQDATGSGYLGDIWRWDGTNWTWMSGPNVVNQPGSNGTQGVPDAGNTPPSRCGAILWIDASGNQWLFGGWGYASTDSRSFNDLWKWDGTNWTWMSGPNQASRFGIYGTRGIAAPENVPGARYASVSWSDATGNLWMFGGYGYAAAGVGFLNDLWKWDGTSWTWVSGSDAPAEFGTYGTKGVAAVGNVPGARGRPVSWKDPNGDLWLFGGKGNSEHNFGVLNDLWRWNGTNWTWMSGSKVVDQFGEYGTTGVAASGNVPGGRHSSVSWSDASGNSWVFGGNGRASTTMGFLNDLWKWDGTTWTWVSGSDEANALGIYGSKGLPDPANVPGAREYAISWTDPSGDLWLFGGRTEATSSGRRLNDLWRWDGANWTWLSGSDGFDQLGTYGTRGVADLANAPGARELSIAWTGADGGLWLFGGYGYAATQDNWTGPLNDLWKWNGTAWTWVGGSNALGESGAYGVRGGADPANLPGSREFSISWTDTAGNLWLFGGSGIDSGGLAGLLNDLWVFGTDCSQVAAPTAANGGPYGTGATIRLTATTVAGATYSWSGPNGFTSAAQNPAIPNATLAMAGTYSVTATVGACTSASGTTAVSVVPGQYLSVSKMGAGTGSISSSPSGIDCPGTCFAWFPGASQVTLTAIPDGGSRFAGWMGEGCVGTGSCTVSLGWSRYVSATFLPSAGSGFFPLAPCRVVDTRNAWGPWGGPALSAGETRIFHIAGQCGVPADAGAVALNVTVTNPTDSGSLTVYPGWGPGPATSTVAFSTGRTRANNATIGLVGGVLSVADRQVSGTVDLIVDVSGYFR